MMFTDTIRLSVLTLIVSRVRPELWSLHPNDACFVYMYSTYIYMYMIYR